MWLFKSFDTIFDGDGFVPVVDIVIKLLAVFNDDDDDGDDTSQSKNFDEWSIFSFCSRIWFIRFIIIEFEFVGNDDGCGDCKDCREDVVAAFESGNDNDNNDLVICDVVDDEDDDWMDSKEDKRELDDDDEDGDDDDDDKDDVVDIDSCDNSRVWSVNSSLKLKFSTSKYCKSINFSINFVFPDPEIKPKKKFVKKNDSKNTTLNKLPFTPMTNTRSRMKYSKSPRKMIESIIEFLFFFLQTTR